MPEAPGVHVEEGSGGDRTIREVPTSIAVFVGWAAKGPVDRAKQVLSWADFEREFGGLDGRSLLGYSVYHFFLNGGGPAYVIRLAKTSGANAVACAGVRVHDGSGNDLEIRARDPGSWGNDYGIETKPTEDDASRFDIAVWYKPGTPEEIIVETFRNLSMDEDDRRYAVSVLEKKSSLVEVSILGSPKGPPTQTPSAQRLAGGKDGDVLEPNTLDFHAALALDASRGGVSLPDDMSFFNLLCVPGESDPKVLAKLQSFCARKRAFLIADCAEGDTCMSLQNGPPSEITGNDSINSAFYFPWVNAPDPLRENQTRSFPPCGFLAGIYARIDAARGVWKAPAGIEANLAGVIGPKEVLTDHENDVLNQRAVNCIRNIPVHGTLCWGARTTGGSDAADSEFKYVPIRRLALFIEESLYRGTQWVVFEPNDEPLWAQIRHNVGAFMHRLFRHGAFKGMTPGEAYIVKCDGDTTTQNDIDQGIVRFLVGFAPLKPAEFVVIEIELKAGQTAS